MGIVRMKPHVKIYLSYFGYSVQEFIPCEMCGAKATDIHHIDARGMGGDPQGKKDTIENLQALCRPCHIMYGDKVQYKETLKRAHECAIGANKHQKGLPG
jgi:hypothetical protein